MSRTLDLRTILNLLPRLAHLDGRPIEEACTELELSRPELLALIQSASSLAWGGHDEGELIDVWEEEGRLHVHTGGLFERAVRLLPPELLALRLGAAQLAAAGLAADLDLETLLGRIEHGLGGDEPGVAERLRQQVGSQVDPALDAALLDKVLDAARERRLLRMWYYSRNSDRLRPRLVEPWKPFQEHGIWYLQALDRDQQAERIFRLDRIVELSVLAESFPEPPAERLKQCRLFQDDGPGRTRVRLEGSLGRLAREQSWPDLREEGGRFYLDLRHTAGDPLLRYLLSWVPDVVVEGPELRAEWLSLLDEMAERHCGSRTLEA
ncbi:MAG: WYL domain-containing protein [bacterium]|jgi:proteasome accessory factor C|nr:WYL domain-containing protein [bacterium]